MKNLTEKQAVLLKRAWRGAYEAYNALEDLRPGGGFESDETRNMYEGVICRGSVILGTGCGSCEKCKDELRRTKETALRVDKPQGDRPTPTIESVIETYEKFKFLESYQVEWLIGKAAELIEKQKVRNQNVDK